jgi:hypothetical protein
MNGLHQLLGFKNTMYVVEPGDGLKWGYYMDGWQWLGIWLVPPRTVTQAWFEAVDDVQPSVTCARVLAETNDNYNDHLWGRGYVSPDPVDDGYYNYWDHCSSGGGSKLSSMGINQPALASMPRMMVQERIVDEDFVNGRIVPAFNMTGTLMSDEDFFYLVDTSGGMTQTLQVDRMTGGFSYRNLSKLWTVPAGQLMLPNMDQVVNFMDNWFKLEGEALPGVWSRDFNGAMYEIEQIVTESLMPQGNGEMETQVLGNTPTDGMLTYPRMIPGMANTSSGTQLVDFPVFGPGGRLKFYFGEMDGANPTIIGAQGGTRDVLAEGQVEVMDYPEAWAMFIADPNIALPEVPWVADYITYTATVTPTLGYYELPYSEHQTELIPVWAFSASFYSGGNLLAGDVDVYVPAAKEYILNVNILSPVEGAEFKAGEPIQFEGSVENGTPPYTYDWTSSGDGYLGNTIKFTQALSAQVKEGDVVPQEVKFEVTDANGLSASHTISLNITPNLVWIWMPTILK